MKLRLQFDTTNISWERVAEILQTVGMAYHDSALHKTAFENSYVVVFAFDEDEMIGLAGQFPTELIKRQFMTLQYFLNIKGKALAKP